MLYVFPDGWTMRVGSGIRYPDAGAGRMWVQYLLMVHPDGRRETRKYGQFEVEPEVGRIDQTVLDGTPFPTVAMRRQAVKMLQQLHAAGHCTRFAVADRPWVERIAEKRARSK